MLVVVITAAFIDSYMIPRAHRPQLYHSFTLRVAILLVGIALLSFFEVLERVDLVIYDKLATMQRYVPGSDVVIVAIDEKSLQAFGRWPWSRKVHADLINRLANIGNKIVVFDVLFSEPEERDLAADEILGDAIAMHGGVILPVIPASDPDLEATKVIEPLSSIGAYATLAHADIELDRDGVARRVFLYAGIDASKWPTIGLALAGKIDGVKKYVSLEQMRTESVSAGGRWIRSNEAMVAYIGPPGSIKQVSYAQIFYDESVLASLKDKIILVGMTASGMGTRFATPFSPINRQPMSGVEWHANVFEMLRHDRNIHPVSNLFASFFAITWLLIILTIVGLLKKPFPVSVLVIMLFGGIVGIGVSLKLLHLWIPPSAALIGTMAIYSLWNWHKINEFMRSLLVAKVHADATSESVGDGLITTDAQDHIIHMNSRAEKILAVALNSVRGTTLQQILAFDTPLELRCSEVVKSEIPVYESGTSTIPCYLKTVNDDQRALRIKRHLLRDGHGELIGFIIVISDDTDTTVLNQKITRLVSYDALTELPNRSLLLAKFEEMAEMTKKTRKPIFVFFVTLDNFKKINDALGHWAGDTLLRNVAKRLQSIAGKDEPLARWSGDEFVMLFHHLSNDYMASQLAPKILETIREQFDIDNQAVFVTASIGIGSYPQDGEKSEIVLERAGTAMYRIKDSGGNNFGFYSPVKSIIWTRDRLEFEKELRLALKNGYLQVYYQPIVDINQDRIVRMEALVRWPHPDRGLLSPGEFIPLAEQVGLIQQLGQKVLLSACNAAHDLMRSGKSISVSVNVNPRQLLYGNFVRTVYQVLQRTNLPAESLVLEITENAIVNDIKRAREVLNKIKALGISIALDDFGTGYSSLNLLRKLPIDILKIDKSFICAMNHNAHDLMLTQAIIGLGENLSLSVIAEGVETQQQMQILLEHRCYLQQGFYFSRPVPLESFARTMNNPNYGPDVVSEKQYGALN